MRFPFHTTLLSVAAALSLGCSYPFSLDVSSGVTLPLGAAVNCAEADTGVLAGTIPENGEPDAHGNLTTYEHTFSEGNRCVLRADWQGPLVDMDALRKDADEQMRDLGVEPDDVDVYIRRFEPVVTAVGFDGDGDGDREMVLPGITYSANVGVPESPQLIELEAAEGADLAHPEVTVSARKQRFLSAANKAWREREPMAGVAAVAIDIDLDEAGTDAQLPKALRIDFNVHLYGDAAARAMVHDEDD